MIPAALRRREAIARGLSIRLQAEARVLKGLCAEAERDGYMDSDVERVAHYCTTLEEWCTGDRPSSLLAGAANTIVLASTRIYDKPYPMSGNLVAAAADLAYWRAEWCKHPTHAPRYLEQLVYVPRRNRIETALLRLRPALATSEAARAVLEALYLAEVRKVKPSFFAQLTVLETGR